MSYERYDSDFKKDGRPLKYSSPEELAAKIEEYIQDTPDKELTVTGLCLAVGSRSSFYDYAERDGYGDVIRWAQLYVENSYERSLRVNGGAGNIFALKNFGWKDKQDIAYTGNLSGAVVIVTPEYVGDNAKDD